MLLFNICGSDIRSVILQPFKCLPYYIRLMILTERKLLKVYTFYDFISIWIKGWYAIFGHLCNTLLPVQTFPVLSPTQFEPSPSIIMTVQAQSYVQKSLSGGPNCRENPTIMKANTTVARLAHCHLSSLWLIFKLTIIARSASKHLQALQCTLIAAYAASSQ